MVIADGAGEYEHDFSVVYFEARSPEEAAGIAVSPENGYGRRNGGTIYVVPATDVSKFAASERIVVELERAE